MIHGKRQATHSHQVAEQRFSSVHFSTYFHAIRVDEITKINKKFFETHVLPHTMLDMRFHGKNDILHRIEIPFENNTETTEL